MQITLRFVGYLQFKGINDGDVVEVADGTTVAEFLSAQSMQAHHQRLIIPVVNGEKKRLTYELQADDELQLFLPVGGG